MFEDKIQNAILAAIDSIITPRIDLAFRSIDRFCGRDSASVMAKSDRGEHIGTTASFENVSDGNNTLHEIKVNDETGGQIPDELVNFWSLEPILTNNHTLFTKTPPNLAEFVKAS